MERKQKDWFGPHRLYLGIDVGKSFHWAVGLDPDGTIEISRRQDRCQADVDALLDEAGAGVLVIVDQKNNIGSLIVRRCRAKGIDVGYLLGKAMKYAREMFPGTAKNDRIDAEAIAQTGIGIRTAIRPIAETDEPGASVSLLYLQLSYATRRATMARNRLHAVLLKSDPAAEPAADLSSAWQLAAMAEYAGATGLAAGRRRYCTLCARQGVPVQARDAFWKLSMRSGSSSFHPDAEDMLARSLAREILTASSERAELSAELGHLLQDDKTYRCLLTIPGIGPKTASALATSIDISLFPKGQQARCILRPRACGPRLQILHQVAERRPWRQQGAQEPPHIQLQLSRGDEEPVREVLRYLRREGHEAQQGAQGTRTQEAARHLCGDARPGAICGAASGRCRKVTCYGLTEL